MVGTMWRPAVIGDTEGCRLLSLQVCSWGDLEKLRKRCGFAGGMIGRYLAGEREPGGRSRVTMRRVLGIPEESWDISSKRAARRKTGTDG
jgi:hypothetical protein